MQHSIRSDAENYYDSTQPVRADHQRSVLERVDQRIIDAGRSV